MCAIPTLPCAGWPYYAAEVSNSLHVHSTVSSQEAVARTVFQQMLDGLDYCHRRGIYHRYSHAFASLLEQSV